VTNIRDIFDTIASRYDCTNTVISCGYAHIWYRNLARAMLQHAVSFRKEISVLDLCCGTGIATERFLKALKKSATPQPHITCIDFSEKMLSVARTRLPTSVTFHIANAASLPCENASFDIICMSFGYRNLIDKEQTLMEIARVLKHNGRLFILELTQPTFPITTAIHSILLKYVIPILGKLVTGHIEPYRYLATSIKKFNLQNCLQEFSNANLVCLSMKQFSFGTCTLLEVAHA
jgi:demethylmenaquinone methyltransferase / 2-methoxy-6-polyprenyl-1,4-benzoquinol methylase